MSKRIRKRVVQRMTCDFPNKFYQHFLNINQTESLFGVIDVSIILDNTYKTETIPKRASVLVEALTNWNSPSTSSPHPPTFPGDWSASVAGRPGKCRPRKAVAQPSKEAGAGQVDVRAELPRSVRLEHHPEQQRFQRARLLRRQALLQLTDGHCCATTAAAHAAPARDHGVHVVLAAAAARVARAPRLHVHDRAQEGDAVVAVASEQVGSLMVWIVTEAVGSVWWAVFHGRESLHEEVRHKLWFKWRGRN